MNTVSTLQHPFLNDLTPDLTEKLLKGSDVKTFQAGDVIFRQGEPANRFYLILSGKVALETPSSDIGMVQIQAIEGGDVLGWSWLFPPFAWNFQARAIESTRAICCDGAWLLNLAEENPKFGYQLMKRISRIVINRLQITRQRLIESETVLCSD